jgi:hypothetical protein
MHATKSADTVKCDMCSSGRRRMASSQPRLPWAHVGKHPIQRNTAERSLASADTRSSGAEEGRSGHRRTAHAHTPTVRSAMRTARRPLRERSGCSAPVRAVSGGRRGACTTAARRRPGAPKTWREVCAAYAATGSSKSATACMARSIATAGRGGVASAMVQLSRWKGGWKQTAALAVTHRPTGQTAPTRVGATIVHGDANEALATKLG